MTEYQQVRHKCVLQHKANLYIDVRLIECVSLRVDESILTGEHKASRKQPNALERYTQ